MKKLPRAVLAVNLFGMVGYMLLLTVWAFFVAILLALAFDASSGMEITEVTRTAGGVPAEESSAVLMAASYVLTAVIVMISVGVVVTLPYFIGKWGSRILRWLMEKARIDVTRRQLFLVKCIATTLPLIGLLISNFLLIPESITFAAMYGATVGVAVVAIICFLVQLFLARRLNIPIEKVW